MHILDIIHLLPQIIELIAQLLGLVEPRLHHDLPLLVLLVRRALRLLVLDRLQLGLERRHQIFHKEKGVVQVITILLSFLWLVFLIDFSLLTTFSFFTAISHIGIVEIVSYQIIFVKFIALTVLIGVIVHVRIVISAPISTRAISASATLSRMLQ
jgi:hypothetical protein